jgi:endonuclease III
MIYTDQVTDFHKSQECLEEFVLFAIAVANKSAEPTAHRVDRLLMSCPQVGTPFQKIKHLIDLEFLGIALVHHRFGQYNRIARAYKEVVALAPEELLDVEKLESIHGIGPKTARFIVLHSKEDARVAVLDTHILKWLRDLGHKVPKVTPKGKRYEEVERLFLSIADDMKMHPATLDLQIWKSYAQAESLEVEEHEDNS